MKNHYDVIIIGAGPAGLRCTELLAPSELKVLVIEKKQQIGSKICAGGITRKFFDIYDFPPALLEKRTNKVLLTASTERYTLHYEEPFLFSIDRKTLGQWQLSRIDTSRIDLVTGRQVTHIHNGFIEIDRKIQIGYRHLVGADGASSLVRRYLKLRTSRHIMALQYKIPWRKNDIPFEIIMNGHYFKSGYAWVFPHNNYLDVGCGVDPHVLSPKKIKENFHRWIKERGFDISQAAFESYPILYDYQGFHFQNIFLAGEAAGLTSGLTGEGIYPALVSGEAVANAILNEANPKEAIDKLLNLKRKHEKILRFINITWPFQAFNFNLIIRFRRNETLQRP